MDLKFSDLVQLISEDQTGYADKWATGMSGRNMGPQRLSIVDLLSRGQLDQHPNKVKAVPGLPHSTQNMVQLLGDLYLHVDQIKQALKVAADNPILDERPVSSKKLEEMIEKLDSVEKMVMSVGQDIDDFALNTETKEKKKDPHTAKEKRAHLKKLKRLEK